MRHLNLGRKFDRNASNREAMFKNLVANLLAHGQIETTVPKAKEVRRIAERVITRAKRVGPDLAKEEVSDAVAARRLAVKRDLGRFLPRFSERLVDGEPERLDVVEHLFREVAPRYLQRPGGYTQILKTRNRRGDNAEMALIRLMPADNAGSTVSAKSPVAEAAVEAAPVAEAVRAKAPKAKKSAKAKSEG